MRRCFHCLEPACESACPTTALERQPDGPTTYDADKCIGCRYCVWACPWGVPTAEWDKLAPKIEKCTHCADRTSQPAPALAQRHGAHEGRDEALRSRRSPRRRASRRARRTACASATRDEMLARGARSASRTTRRNTWTTSTARTRRAGRASSISRPCRSRSSASRTSAKKPFPAFTKTALARGAAGRHGDRRAARRWRTRSSGSASRPSPRTRGAGRRPTTTIRSSRSYTGKLLTPFN